MEGIFFVQHSIAQQFLFYVEKNKMLLKGTHRLRSKYLIYKEKKCTEFDLLREETVSHFHLYQVQTPLNIFWRIQRVQLAAFLALFNALTSYLAYTGN